MTITHTKENLMNDTRWCPKCAVRVEVLDEHVESDRNDSRFLVTNLDCGHDLVVSA